MNAGDTIKVILNYTVDGEPLPSDFDGEIELTIGSIRLTKTGEDIVWDSDEGAFVAYLDQEDTFSLRGTCQYQVRLKNSEGSVVSSSIQTMTFGKTLSTTEI